MDIHDRLFLGVGLFLLVLLGGLAVIAVHVVSRDNRYMRDCMVAHQEWECAAMLRGNATVWKQ